MTETPNPNIIDADTLTGEMRPIRRAVLSLGSNLGERMDNLQGAVRALADTPDVWVTGVSPVYETEPVDAPDGSDMFLNAVVLADTTLAATRLLDRALAIEDAFDRERSEVSNAPRTLDVDLIVVGDRRATTTSSGSRTRGPRSARSCCAPGSTSTRRRSSPTAARWPTCSPPSARAGSSVATTSSSTSSDHRPDVTRDVDPHLDPGSDDDREEPPDPTGRLRPTSYAVVTAWAAGGLVLGWLWQPGGRGAQRHRAAGLLGPARRRCGWWRSPSASRGGRPTGPCRSGASGWSRTARSTGWCSPARGRWWGRWWPAATPGTPLSWIGDPAELAGQRILRSAVAVLAGIAMVVFALLLERACQVRRDRD